MTSLVLNQMTLLEAPRSFRYAGTPGANHLRAKRLREIKLFAIKTVLDHE